ncbi:MAG: prepilin-type N-terminal cleavage/methylation domain-containing protein, partial [Chloroflexi bacterium]|nr:prepilin-type N-terminal cleavage/methylation domain-containing protein [Chloroflexota bacterium]
MAKVRVGVRQAGLSLIELTVVAAVIAILAALTTVAVTGVATSTRGTTRTSDM